MASRKYGYIKSKPDPRDVLVRFNKLENVSKKPKSEPVVFDLRSQVKLPQALSNIDQGSLGSCTANAIAFAYAFDEIRQLNKEIFLPSRLFIYYNERLIEGTVDQDSGAQIRDGIKSINTYGVCDEHHWIYDPTRFTVQPPANVYTEAKKAKSVTYATIDFSSDTTITDRINHLKKALQSGFPFVFGFTVFESFESEIVATTGLVPLPSANEQSIGGHAVCAIGFDDSKQSFIVKNSWGPNWGLNGYFYMPYNYTANADLAEDFWIIKRVTNPNDIPNFNSNDINPDAQNLNVDSSN